MSLARNRVTMANPAPMDIGRVGFDEWEEDQSREEGWHAGAEVEVDYVGNGGGCLRCGGVGHFAREFGTPKGKGKGDSSNGKGKMGGKGEGKTGRKGWQKGGFGWGMAKGYGKKGGKATGKGLGGDQ